MAQPTSITGLSVIPNDSTISVHTEDHMILPLKYGPETTILQVKLELQTLKGYAQDEHQLRFPGEAGEAVIDKRLVQEVARETSALCLNRVSIASSAAESQSRSSHSYNKIEGEETSQQYIGNVGVLPSGSSFGSHKYNDIRAKGHSMQMLGDMASFPPGFGAIRKVE